MSQTADVTLLLQACRGDEDALHALMPVAYGEMRRIARKCLYGDRHRHSVQATALVNEAFLRLVDARRVEWQNRAQFLAMCARLMRRVFVDLARARGAEKRVAVRCG